VSNNFLNIPYPSKLNVIPPTPFGGRHHLCMRKRVGILTKSDQRIKPAAAKAVASLG